MSKKHLKRISAPRSWKIKRKGIKFVIRPNPGPHPIEKSLPLGIILRDLLNYAKTMKEVKYILNNKRVAVDGIRRKEHKFPVGLFDVIEIENEFYRVIFNKKGKIELISIDSPETSIKPCRIIGKTKIKGKTQLNLYDGKNILVDNDIYKCGDSILLEFPNNIKDHIKLDKGVIIYLTGGKHIGTIGKVDKILGKKLTYKNREGDLCETLKEYAFVIGKDSPIISIKE